MTIRQADHFLTGPKLKLQRYEAGRHTGYELWSSGRRIGLPTLVRLSRGTGDLPDRDVRSIAGALGLRKAEFEAMERCNLRGECMLLAVAAKLLTAYHFDPFVFGRGALESIALILDEMTEDRCSRWNKMESQCVGRLRSDLEGIRPKLTEDAETAGVRIMQLLNTGQVPPAALAE